MVTVPAYIQQQFLSMIRVLHEHVGQEATRAYSKSLCTDASLDNLLSKDRTQSIFGLLALTFTMDSNIPLHLQRQMAIVIRELQNIVSLEVTKTYLGFLSWTMVRC